MHFDLLQIFSFSLSFFFSFLLIFNFPIAFETIEILLAFNQIWASAGEVSETDQTATVEERELDSCSFQKFYWNYLIWPKHFADVRFSLETGTAFILKRIPNNTLHYSWKPRYFARPRTKLPLNTNGLRANNNRARSERFVNVSRSGIKKDNKYGRELPSEVIPVEVALCLLIWHRRFRFIFDSRRGKILGEAFFVIWKKKNLKSTPCNTIFKNSKYTND